jgi:replicative DNA helicase
MNFEADLKVFSYLLLGAKEFNDVNRYIDINLLMEACHYDVKSLATVIKDYYDSYKSPPTFSLLEEYLVDDFENLQLLSLIQDTKCNESEVKFFIDQIRKRYNKYLAKKIANALPENESEFDKDEFNKELHRIQAKIERLYKNAVFTEGEIKDSIEERIGKYNFVEKNPYLISGVFTGYKELDEYLWGIKNSELMVIAGASSSGKSLMMLNIAINAWLGSNDPLSDKQIIDDGKNIIFFSLEMSKEQLEERIDSNLAKIITNNITRGKMNDSDKSRYYKVMDFIKKYNKKFYICDIPRGSKMSDIESRYDSIISEFNADLVCIDYLQLLVPNRAVSHDWLSVGYVAEEMHEFCRSKNIPVITAAQRKAKGKKEKEAYNDTEDLGRSKMIGDNSSIVLLIDNRENEILKDDMVIHVTKNRQGAKGKFSLLKEFDKARIENLPDDWAGDLGEENEY